MSIQVEVLWPLPAESQVSCQLSETSDSRQGWHDQRAGPCWTGQPSALWTDRHVAVISLWQAVRATGEPPTSTRPLSSHLTTDGGEALNSQPGTRTPLLLPPPPPQHITATVAFSEFSRLLYLRAASVWCLARWWRFDIPAERCEKVIRFKCLASLRCVPPGADVVKSYKRRRCKPVKWHNWHFITRDVSAARDSSVGLRECVYPQTSLWSPPPTFSVSPVWQVTFGVVQEMYVPFVSMAGSEHVTWPAGQRAREKILISPARSIRHREALIIGCCQSISSVFLQPFKVSLCCEEVQKVGRDGGKAWRVKGLDSE